MTQEKTSVFVQTVSRRDSRLNARNEAAMVEPSTNLKRDLHQDLDWEAHHSVV
jgi:hypothetical protein